jgi:molybdopterin-guanine dinucleotide biosynthesis protein A
MRQLLSGADAALSGAVCGVILAGGKSRRMGRDKALLDIQGLPLIERLRRRMAPWAKPLIIAGASERDYPFLSGVRFVPDPCPGRGPLEGLCAALATGAADFYLVLSCDIPQFPPSLPEHLLREIGDADIAAPDFGEMGPEPLCTLYRAGVLTQGRALLGRNNLRLKDLLSACRTRAVRMDGGWHVNLNTPSDYEAYLSSLKTRQEASDDTI